MDCTYAVLVAVMATIVDVKCTVDICELEDVAIIELVETISVSVVIVFVNVFVYISVVVVWGDSDDVSCGTVLVVIGGLMGRDEQLSWLLVTMSPECGGQSINSQPS